MNRKEIYRNIKDTNILKNVRHFFAFSEKHVNQALDDLKVTKNDVLDVLGIGYGCYIHRDDKEIFEANEKEYEKLLNDFLKDPENLKAAIWYELNNHEIQYGGSIEYVWQAIGIEKSEANRKLFLSVYSDYMNHCLDNDLI